MMPQPAEAGEQMRGMRVDMTYRQAKQSFGTCDDEGFAEVALHLPPQEMEVLGRRRRECDVHVHIRRHIGHLVRVVGELQIGAFGIRRVTRAYPEH